MQQHVLSGAKEVRRAGAGWMVVLAALVALLGGAGHARAGDDERVVTPPLIDAETGRENWNYPPARHFDFDDLVLRIDLGLMDVPRLTGVATWTARAVGTARTEVELDASGLEIGAVRLGKKAGSGAKLAYRQEGRKLIITLPRACAAGQEVAVTVEYTVDFSGHQGNGLTWSAAEPEAESATDRAPSIHSQGQSEWNHTWFPCPDFPNDRFLSRMAVTAPAGYRVLSNGVLVERAEERDGRRTWRWKLGKPHPAYLVTLAVGKYSVVDLRKPGGGAALTDEEALKLEMGRTGTLPVFAYVPAGLEAKAQETLGDTPAMIDFFAVEFDEPYPWEKYAQVFARDFRWGGMENTSATTLVRTTLNGTRESEMDLVSHELAHQWFGDLVTCRGWEHTWLNEGWASFAEALWREHFAAREAGEARTGPAGREAYRKVVRHYLDELAAKDHTRAPEDAAMVSGRYASADDPFEKPDDPYAKGAALLHALRMKLGAEGLRRAAAAYLDRYKFTEVETDQFRRVLEDETGVGLERFFAQYVYRAGIPRIAVRLEHDDKSRAVVVKMRQTQPIDGFNPAFAVEVPVVLRLKDGTERHVTVMSDARENEARIEDCDEPAEYAVDPEWTAPAVLDVTTGWGSGDEARAEPLATAEPEDAGAHEGSAAADESVRPRGDMDVVTGRDLLNYPPDRPVDFEAMKLEVVIADMNVPRLWAREQLTFTVMGGTGGRGAKELVLDAVAFEKILSVRAGAGAAVGAVPFMYDGERLTIEFGEMMAPGTRGSVEIEYLLKDPPLGMTWTPESPAWPGRAAQLHTQGQPQTNSYWFACRDFPNDRMKTEVAAVVPTGFVVSSNGRLAGRSRVAERAVDGMRTLRDAGATSGGASGYERFAWVQDEPHVAYLVSLVVGKFEVVERTMNTGAGDVAWQVYAPAGRGGDAALAYARTGDMLRFFAMLFDEPYPWDRYAQLVVHNFAAGGMENTGATTMHDNAVLSGAELEDRNLEGLIAHEMVHQWFGDLVTCRSWEHVWLNEGFATYSDALWSEHNGGEASGVRGSAAARAGRDRYDLVVRGWYDGLSASDRPEAPYAPALASKEYAHPWDVFRKAANPYPKGASVLHMLRVKLGDEVFFRGIAAYIDEYKHGLAETDDLRRVLERVSGEQLQQFFRQWVYRPGVPQLVVRTAWDEAGKALTVDVEQTQTIDERNPAYEFRLPVFVRMSEKSEAGMRADVEVRGRRARRVMTLPGRPALVEVDPGQAVLAGVKVEMAEDWRRAQARSGSTAAARVMAIRALGQEDGIGAAETLNDVARRPGEMPALAAEAVRALAKPATWNFTRWALHGLEAGAGVAAVEVRLAAVQGVRAVAHAGGESGSNPGASAAWRDDAWRALEWHWMQDKSPRVRCAALAGLVTLDAARAWGLVEAAARMDGPEDCYRVAALEGAQIADSAEGLALAIELTREGVNGKTRPKALGAVSGLRRHNPQAAFEAVAALVREREVRLRFSAWQTLGEWDEPAGAVVLGNLMPTLRSEEERAAVRRAIARIEAKKQPVR